MPQAIPVGFIYALETFAVNFLINVALNYLVSYVTRPPEHGRLPENVTIRSTVPDRQLIAGEARSGGALVYANTSGTNNKYLWFVVAYASHQCNALKDAWLDSVRIPAADINGTTGAVSTASFDGKLKIWDHLGTGGQAVDSNLDAEFAEWTSNHRLQGICYRVFRFQRSDDAFPGGAPQNCSSRVEGFLSYDSRLDSTNGGSGSHRRDDPSTWSYSRNWARNIRWFLSGGSVVNDQTTRIIRFGVQEADSRIDDAFFAAAANIADQSLSGGNAPPSGAQVRYTLDMVFACSETRRDILEDMLAAGFGQLVNLHGKWRLYAGAYDAPIHTFTQDDLHGELEIEDTSGDEDRFNQISGVYFDEEREWTEQTTPVRSNSAYVTQDAGKEIPRPDVPLRGCTNQYRAQRILELQLRRARQMRKVVFRFGRQGMKIAPWETFSMSHTRYGWSSRVFRSTERMIERTDSGGVIVKHVAIAEASSIYTDLVTADYTTGTSVTNSLQSEPPDPPTGLTALTGNGYIQFTWSLEPFWLLNGTVELWQHTANTPFASATKIWEGAGTLAVIPKTDQTTGYYWVRVRAKGGQTSTTEPPGNGLAGVAYNPTFVAPVADTPSDGNISYGAVTQPQVEASGIGSHITYTSPANVATRCIVNFAGQANISNTTSGGATGYALIAVTVQVNGSTVFTASTRLEACLAANDAWGVLAGSKAFDVPAGQAIDVYLSTGRSFSTGGSSPAQTIYHRACHTEILPTKQ